MLDYKIIKKDDKDIAQDKVLNDIFKMSGMNKIYLLGFANAFDVILRLFERVNHYTKNDILSILEEITKQEDFINDNMNEVYDAIIKKHR